MKTEFTYELFKGISLRIFVLTVLVIAAFCPSVLCADVYCGNDADGAYVKTTGIGYYSLKHSSDPVRSRLMARRAAIVDSYRKLARTYSSVGGKIARFHPGFYERTEGYIQGAQILETRYFSNGKVEVDTIVRMDVPYPEQEMKYYKQEGLVVCQVDSTPRQISREEFTELMGK